MTVFPKSFVRGLQARLGAPGGGVFVGVGVRVGVGVEGRFELSFFDWAFDLMIFESAPSDSLLGPTH